MNNTSRVTTLPGTWESRLLEENKYLKEFIGGVSIDEIKRLRGLEKDNASLKTENKALRDAEEKLMAAHAETVKAIKAEADARIEAANKAHTDGSSRQRGVWESQVSDLRFQNNKLAAEKLAANKEVDTLKSEVSRLESENKKYISEINNRDIKIESLEKINNQVIEINNQVKQTNVKLDHIIDMIQQLAESGDTEQIVEVIQDVKNETSKIEKIKALIDLEAQGFTSAKDLLPRLEHLGVKHASRISELRKSKEYKNLKGGDSHVEA